MSSVNGSDPVDHVPRLMGALFEQVRATFATDDWHGLRPSHFRLLEAVPAEGITITELSPRLGMTKQGCGQFVAQLSESGHLRVVPDPVDRRSKVVRRTSKGTRLTRKVQAHLAAVEANWAEQVGARRYADFRAVLTELARTTNPTDVGH